MLAITKVAAMIVAAAGGLIFFTSPPPGGARPLLAFADTAQKLREAHGFSYRMTIESPDTKPAPPTRFLFKEPALFRGEQEGGVVSIVDGSDGRQIILDPVAKTALLIEGKPAKPAEQPGAPSTLVERLRKLTADDAKPAGVKTIGKVEAPGFLVNKLGFAMTIWVDPETHLPLRIESSQKVQEKEYRVVLTDFELDPKVDDALFRIEAPAGYALTKSDSELLGMDEKTFTNPEKAAVALLRIYAGKTGGTFPKDINDLSEFDRVFPKKKGERLPDAETLRAVQALTRFMLATRSLKEKLGYRSEGVTIRDANKILLWYRPAGATRYRAVYGDLHAADVDADQLPEKPNP